MRVRAVDLLIAVAVAAATTFPPLWYLPFDWRTLALGLLASLPLIWRRRAPILVASLIGIGTTWLSVLHLLPDMPYGQLVATYTWAELATPRWRVASIAATTAGVVFSLVVPQENPPSFGYVGLMFVTAYALGAGVRGRRDRIAFLEERTRRLTEEQAAAATNERARIARDMHDVLAHSVGLMVVQAEGGASVVRSDQDRAEAAFDAIAETGREALVQLRHALGVLREQAPEAAGLDAIPSLVERARRTGLDVRLERGPVPAVPEETGATAFRVVQEALTNVVKHAGAQRVLVTLHGGDRAVEVIVRDDGRGGTAVYGHGLSGMLERVQAAGGTLRTGPRGDDGPGFEVAATLPVGGRQ
ncbi:sensor histidine kinase [Dactylosporangium matsuzakiense]|uniref:histidine kinase n=1 Tax=Dactylosporangium matsuzakiense TaxID=53360 RepID=A0A9W6NMT5_9ACTN|nr:sensor histidine kinase [Dactylosporangium matsuzakiense]GLL02789.1 two-component sensor histidine kinase [Dactylosporangium matsuzakiense]